jgi:hypothetical protein
MDLTLNLIFGFIGIVSLAYAIWQNRAAENAKILTTRVTKNIQQLAREIMIEAPNSPSSAYAQSIAHIADSLSGSRDRISDLGNVEMTFLAPQFNKTFGTLEFVEGSKFGVALTGTYDGAEWLPESMPPGTMGGLKYDAVLAWGPYVNLPVPGRYKIEYRVRSASHSVPRDAAFAYIDVFDYAHDKYYARKKLTANEIQSTWQRIGLTIEYIDTSAKLEFRVATLRPGILIQFDLVHVQLDTLL